ncbi:hypothetical protein SAMN05192553_11220 [Cyclobacterium xiamenense]|uniref:CopG family transcriptional regulator n=1 Tax=Cyclobacterium xiamenense TaxID=1297121 RepID=A0A1H7BRL3_9BACT|nr:hypothetical protein [Cyclobacterium xiamenense]SEJ76940.1 hypothetical protein SAMN05192553_11220 [Cyclobacterium xiamenense]
MKRNFIASVERGFEPQIEQIAKDLQDRGCTISQILKLAGIISGCTSGEEKDLQELKIKGIRHIEEDRQVRALGGEGE